MAMAHSRLGRPRRRTFLGMLNLSGASQQAIQFAKVWVCAVCLERQAPDPTNKSSAAKLRPYGFNVTVSLDLKFTKDVKGKAHGALSVVCAGTTFHGAYLIRTKHPRYVSRKIVRRWIAPFGVPLRIVHDQGAGWRVRARICQIPRRTQHRGRSDWELR